MAERTHQHRVTTPDATWRPAAAPRAKRVLGGSDTASEREADAIASLANAAWPRPALAASIRAVPDGARGQRVPSPVEGVLGTPGTALDTATRGVMEQRFGHDFSRVRVHADAGAAGSARAIGAIAYTAGHHIVFGQGRFRPDAASGRRLIAHELAHVVQQSQLSPGILPPVQRRVEMRDVGRGEQSGLARLPELIERLNAISTGLTFAMEGRNLTFEPREGAQPSHFDQQMMAFINDEARVIPLRLTNRHGRMGTREEGYRTRVEVDGWFSGYVDIDDLLASTDLGLQLMLLHFLRERQATSNYARRIGTPSMDDSQPGPAREFDRVHARGIDEEVALLRAFFGDPTIRFVGENAGVAFRIFRNARRDVIQLRMTIGRGAERRGIDAVSVRVRTRDGRTLTATGYRDELARERAAAP